MSQRVVFSGESEFGDYRVVDGEYSYRDARVLYGPDDTPQSGVALDDDPELLFSYNQRFLEMLQTIQPERVLVIGGGTMTLPMAIRRQFPTTTIDVVEINPLLPQLARDFFGFSDEMNVSVFVQDGVEYMRSTTTSYDAIIVDAFSGRSVVTELFTQEIIQQYSEKLTRRGALLINYVSRYFTRQHTLSHTLTKEFSRAFKFVELYPADPEEPKRHEQNIVLAATHESLSYDYLQSFQVTLVPPAPR